MRRAQPRFDTRRNAWVTNAGGRLKTLAPGPKSAVSEAAAWECFYQHMSQLGNPLAAGTPEISLGRLADEFADWMDKEVASGRLAEKTASYYRHFLQKFLDAIGGRRPATSLLPIELERYKSSWHSVQTVQRLYNWGVKMGLVHCNPVKNVQRPRLGERQRVLTRAEVARLLRAADPDFRRFLLAMLYSIARPQEVRALRWKHLIFEPATMFVLTDFKAKQLRREKQSRRVIPVHDRLLRLLIRLAPTGEKNPEDFIFLNANGLPWTGNAVRCRMRRLREKCKFTPDPNGEKIVAYTFRHTSATNAAIKGVRGKVLAELMGHTRLSTTERYQHFDVEHLADAIRIANRRNT